MILKDNKKSAALLVFVKNTSDVKTRIAAETSAEQANGIYKELLAATHHLCASLQDIDIVVYYSKEYENDDMWSSVTVAKQIQVDGDLGVKMKDAFSHSLEKYEKVIIIGSDCPYIKPSHIYEAIDLLTKGDLVIGRAKDGGYYLIGLSKFVPSLFENISWSSDQVFYETIDIAMANGLRLGILETLTDVDYYKDYLEYEAWKK